MFDGQELVKLGFLSVTFKKDSQIHNQFKEEWEEETGHKADEVGEYIYDGMKVIVVEEDV